MAIKTPADLKVLMGRMREAYYFKTAPATFSASTDLLSSADFEMPISEDGVTFETGSPNITREKLINGDVYYLSAEKGDANIALQVPSFDASLNELFMEKATSSEVSVKVGSTTYKGNGYNLTPKKFGGMWVFTTPERNILVVLPDTENFANLVGATGKAKGYYNVAVNPLKHKTYGEILVLPVTTTSNPT